MKNALIIVGTIIGLYILWYLFTRKNRNQRIMNYSNPSPAQSTTIQENKEDIAPPPAVVDHTDSGYVLIPLDKNGNVTRQENAVQYLKFEHAGQDCQLNYNSRVYFVKFPKFHAKH